MYLLFFLLHHSHRPHAGYSINITDPLLLANSLPS